MVVQLGHQLGAAKARAQQGPQAALEKGHQQGRWHALAGHVANGHRQPPLGQLDQVEVVAAHRVGGPHERVDRGPSLLEGFEGQQAELDLPCNLQVALQHQLVAQLQHQEDEEQGGGKEHPGGQHMEQPAATEDLRQRYGQVADPGQRQHRHRHREENPPGRAQPVGHGQEHLPDR